MSDTSRSPAAQESLNDRVEWDDYLSDGERPRVLQRALALEKIPAGLSILKLATRSRVVELNATTSSPV
jgi:hypothetical protein